MQPNLTQILTLRANLTQLNPILDSEGPTWPNIGIIKCNSNQLDQFLNSEGQPKIGLNLKKRVGFGLTLDHFKP